MAGKLVWHVFAVAMVVAVCGTVDAAVLHQQGFEANTGDWTEYQSALDQVASGTNGIASAGGSWHLELTDPEPLPDSYYSGAYSFLGGSRSNLAVNWTTSIDIFIDLNDERINSGNYGFDLSQAMYDTTGSHEQDNIFHVGAADPEEDSSYEVYVNASHNSDFAVNANKLTNASQPFNSKESPGIFEDSGWYTFSVGFSPSSTKPGYAEVDFSVVDDQGDAFWSADWTTEHYTLSEAGGNGYLWLTFADVESLAIDNVTLDGQVVPEPATIAIWSLLAAAGIGLAWWRRK